MNEVVLIVNDEALDLKNNERIALTFQSQSFNTIADKQGSFSRSFVVPATDRNKRILDYANEYNRNTTFPYRSHEAKLLCNGVELEPGKIIVENDGLSNNEIRLTYYTGNSPFFQLVNNLKVKDICLGDGNHFFSWEKIVLDRTNSKHIYPVIDYTGEALTFGTTQRTIFYENIYPGLFYERAIEGLSDLIGYKFTGAIFQSDDFKKLFFATSEGFERDKNYRVRNTWTTQRTQNELIVGVSVITDMNQSKVLLSDTLNNVTPNTGDFLQLATGTGICGNTIIPQGFRIGWSLNYNLMFSDSVRLHFKITYDGDVIPIGSTGGLGLMWVENTTNPISKQWFTNDPNVGGTTEFYGNPINAKLTINTIAGVYIGSPFAQVISGDTYHYMSSGVMNINPAGEIVDIVYEFDIDVKAHTPYYMRFVSSFATLDVLNLRCECTFVMDKGTKDEDRQIKLLDNNKDDWSRCIVSGNTPLPDIKINDFLKYLAYQFNCILIVDDYAKQVEFFTVKELYDNIPKSKDWSSKVVNFDNAKWNSRASKYGQRSIFKYNNEDGVNPILGEYQMLVDDTTLQEEAEAIKIDYSATEMKFIEGISFPEISRVEDGTYKKGKQRLLYYDLLTTGFPSGISTLSYIDNPALSGVNYNATVSIIPMAYFNKSNAARQLGFEAYIFNEYYRFIDYMINDFKQVTVEMLLSPTDISQLDFRLPVYITQLSTYFYIEKIADWTPGKPCKVTLIKLT